MDQVEDIVRIVRDVLGRNVVGAWLHGSAVFGGFRPDSDVDVLVVVERSLAEPERRELVDALLEVSGRRARRGPGRPVELTVAVARDVRPWRYPPRVDFQYGEWLRDDYERGFVPRPESSPDLVVLLRMVRDRGRPLLGPPPGDVLDDIPAQDLRRAMVEAVPGLLAELETDTRNVLLTLARIVVTLETGDIRTKDAAANSLLLRLPEDERAALARARRGYLEGGDEGWGTDLRAARTLAERLRSEVERHSRR